MLKESWSLAEEYFFVERNFRVFLQERHFIFADRKSTAANATTSLETLKRFEDDEIVFVTPKPQIDVRQQWGYLLVQFIVDAAIVESIVSRKQLMMRKQYGASVSGIVDLVLEPRYLSRIERSGRSSESVVQSCVQTNQLPICIPQTEVTRLLTKLVYQLVERLAA